MGDPSALRGADAVTLSASLGWLMARALKVCSRPGCPTLTDKGRCTDHERQADRQRGTASERGYTGRGHQAFRRAVLRRDPICVCPDTGKHGHAGACFRPSTRADHYPKGRDELVRLRLDPNDPQYGRGLCASCDSSQTSQRQPGGFMLR